MEDSFLTKSWTQVYSVLIEATFESETPYLPHAM